MHFSISSGEEKNCLKNTQGTWKKKIEQMDGNIRFGLLEGVPKSSII